MSQQEFVPQNQGQHAQSHDDEEIYTSYYRPNRRKDKALPKSEHPSTFEDSIPPYSYRAQDEAAPSSEEPRFASKSTYNREQPSRRHFSPDGDAFETGYQPYRQPQMQFQVPPWARPPRHKMHIGRLIVLIVSMLLIAKMIPLLIGLILTLVVVAGIFVLIPVFVALAILIPVLVMIALVVLGIGGPIFLHRRALNGRGWPAGRHYRSWRRWRR